jgi:hypothetical protein
MSKRSLIEYVDRKVTVEPYDRDPDPIREVAR